MNSNLAVQQEEEEEHEVYGADIPLDDDPTDSANSEMPKKEDKLKDLEMIRKRFEEIEREAEMLRAKQARIQKAMGLKKADESSAFGPTLAEKEAVDARSIYIGNVDYECVPEELQEHFKSCGTINRVTIPVDELGMPKGFAYVEFDAPEAVQAALALTGTELHGRQIKVARKRTNIPGMSQFRGRRGYPGYPYPDPYSPYEYGPVPKTKPSSRFAPY